MERMNRKQFIAGLAALGAVPTAAWSDDDHDHDDHDGRNDAEYTADEVTQAGADFFGITT